MKDTDVKASTDTIVLLHDLFPKLCFKRKVIEQFMTLAAAHLKVKDKYIKSFSETNTCRIMNMAGIHLFGQQKNSKMPPLSVYRVKISMRGRGGTEVGPF